MELRDCAWCGSAASIEYGVCQVCLMRFLEPETEEVRVVVHLEPEGLEVEEPGGDQAAAALE